MAFVPLLPAGPKNAEEDRFPSPKGWCRIVWNRRAGYQELFEIIA
jgi:hypothetical protein